MGFAEGDAVIILSGEWKMKVAFVSRVAGDGRVLVHIAEGKIQRFYNPGELASITEAPTRTCNVCHKDLPLTEFRANRKMPLGRAYTCRMCHQKENRREVLLKQQATREHAFHHRDVWTDADLRVLEDPTLTLTEIAVRLGRTYAAVAMKRSHLREDKE